MKESFFLIFCRLFLDKPDHYQESTEIIASLENLNSEIREIWGVLNTKQDNTILPPPPALMYPELNWLTTYPQLTTQPNAVPGLEHGFSLLNSFPIKNNLNHRNPSNFNS